MSRKVRHKWGVAMVAGSQPELNGSPKPVHYVKIRSVPCPLCGAEAGAQCVTSTGEKTNGHRKRRALALRAEEHPFTLPAPVEPLVVLPGAGEGICGVCAAVVLLMPWSTAHNVLGPTPPNQRVPRLRRHEHGQPGKRSFKAWTILCPGSLQIPESTG
jgi:hypothetical protein